MRCFFCSAMTWRTRMSGVTVMGSRSTPDSKRLTLATSAACSFGEKFLWMMPIPPSCAMAIARRASVTVSMAAETSGMFNSSLRVRRDFRETSRGRTREWAGRRRTSSKVSAFWITRMAILAFKNALYASQVRTKRGGHGAYGQRGAASPPSDPWPARAGFRSCRHPGADIPARFACRNFPARGRLPTRGARECRSTAPRRAPSRLPPIPGRRRPGHRRARKRLQRAAWPSWRRTGTAREGFDRTVGNPAEYGLERPRPRCGSRIRIRARTRPWPRLPASAVKRHAAAKCRNGPSIRRMSMDRPGTLVFSVVKDCLTPFTPSVSVATVRPGVRSRTSAAAHQGRNAG